MPQIARSVVDCRDQANRSEPGFLKEVIQRSGVNVSLCWHCLSCGGGCPFADDMDNLPNQTLRLVQFELKKEVLESSALWICVGCHTCSMQCPQAIDIAAVMDTLREMAIEYGVKVGEPDILRFHNEMLKSIHRYGRSHKLEIMMRYKLWKRDWLADMDIGLRMLSKRKLELMPKKVKNLKQLQQLFINDDEGKNNEARSS